MKKGKIWVLVLLAGAFDLLKDLAEHRLLGWMNDGIDEQVRQHWHGLVELVERILRSPVLLFPVAVLWVVGKTLLELRKKPEAEREAAQSAPPTMSIGKIEQNASPVSRFEANPKIEIHNHPAAVSPAPVSPPTPAIEPMHNIQPMRISKCFVDLSGEMFCEVRADEGGHPAFKAGFLNKAKPGTRTDDFNYARARIVYRNKAGDEVCHISKGIWIGHEARDAVHIEANTKQCLLLAVLSGTGDEWCAPFVGVGDPVYWEDHRVNQLDLHPLPAESLTVEMHLIGEGNIALDPVNDSLPLVDMKPRPRKPASRPTLPPAPCSDIGVP